MNDSSLAIAAHFECKACQELLQEPITLPCGFSVCRRCYRPPMSLCNGLKQDKSEGQELQLALESLGVYTCPARPCRKKHRFRNDSVDVLVMKLLERLFPSETKCLGLAKQGEEKLNRYWNPDTSICKDDAACQSLIPDQEQEALKIQDLKQIISEFFDPAIASCPHLQLPYILKAKALAEMGYFDGAAECARLAAFWNTANRRGLVAEKLVAWRQRMYENRLHVLATCALSATMTTIPSEGQDQLHTELAGAVLKAADELRQEMKQVCRLKMKNTGISNSLSRAAELLSQRLQSPDTPVNALTSELECTLCWAPMTCPVTCPCGHTWCKSCILTSIDHSRSCPMCRQKLPQIGYFMKRPSSFILSFLSQWMGTSQDQHVSMNDTETIPFFVCSLIFPGSSQGYHFFEPRYRVMMKRCIEKNKKFGIVLPKSNHPNCKGGNDGIMEYGTLVSIRNFEPLLNCDIVPTMDGNLPRYMVEVVGMYRFKILSITTNEAGYLEGTIQRIEDTEPEDEQSDWNPGNLAQNVHYAKAFVKNLLQSLPPPARLHFQRQHGLMPDDPGDLSFWLAELLPLHPYVLYDMLPMVSVTERMTLIRHWLESVRLSN